MSVLRDLPEVDLSEVAFDVEAFDIERAVRAYRDVGFVVVRGMMREYVAALHGEIDAAVATARRESNDAVSMEHGWITPSGAIFSDRDGNGDVVPGFRRLIVVPVDAGRSETMATASQDQRLRRFVDRVLEGEALLTGAGQCMYKEPHGREAHLHQDSLYLGREGYADAVTVFTYVVPTPIERGCIWVIPHSHRIGLQPHDQSGPRIGALPEDACDFDQAIPVPGDAGDALFWDWNLIHGSKPNRTDLPRPAVAVRFGRRSSSDG